MKTILIDAISSISESYFSYKYRGEVIKEEPFQCKLKEESGPNSTYHFNEEDLSNIERELDETIFPYAIFPYSVHDGYPEFRHLTREKYIDLIKYRLYQIAKLGKVNDVLSLLYGEQIRNVMIKWDETKPGIKKPSFIKE